MVTTSPSDDFTWWRLYPVTSPPVPGQWADRKKVQYSANCVNRNTVSLIMLIFELIDSNVDNSHEEFQLVSTVPHALNTHYTGICWWEAIVCIILCKHCRSYCECPLKRKPLTMKCATDDIDVISEYRNFRQVCMCLCTRPGPTGSWRLNFSIN